MNILAQEIVRNWLKDDPYVCVVLKSGTEIVVRLEDHKLEGVALGDGFLGGYTALYQGPQYQAEDGRQVAFRSGEAVILADEVAAVRRYSPPPAPTKGEW